MVVKSKRRAKRKTNNLPARRRRVTVVNSPKPRRRRRLSAGGNMQVILMQVATAVAGGVIGKVARNAMPADMSPEIKTAVIVAGGIAVAKFSKQPLLGAGMIGSGAAYYTAILGERFKIPLLSEQNANFVLM